MSEAKKILLARADELRLELVDTEAELKLARKSLKALEGKLVEGKDFVNRLSQERQNMRELVAELEDKAGSLA